MKIQQINIQKGGNVRIKPSINKNMKTLGKILICIIVVFIAIGVGYLAYNSNEENTSRNSLKNTATNVQNTNNNIAEKNTTNLTEDNKDYIGEEENKEELKGDKVPEQEEKPVELTGKDKAIDIVQKQYAFDGQTVRFDHMEGNDYVIKLNDGTAVTWYLVDGATWEAVEY